MRLSRRALVALFLAIVPIAAHHAAASVSIAIPLDALVQRSTDAAFVTPVTQTSQWEAGRLVTYTDVHVDTPIVGAGLTDDVWIRTLGGAVGRIGQSVEGEAVLTVGHPALLFLQPAYALSAQSGANAPADVLLPGVYSVTERAQGQFPVVLDAAGALRVHRSSGVGATVAPRGKTSAPLAAEALHGLRVDDARDAVSRAWSQFHDP